nr:DUF4129 domain-containing protein [uncultured Carboxylicivirga sp.]
MKIHFKYILVFVLLLSGFQLKAETDSLALNGSIEAWDNTAVDYRHPSQDTITYYKQHPDYNYIEKETTESLLDRFWRWLLSLFVNKGTTTLFGWAILVLSIFALLAIVIRLFGIPIKGLFVFARSTKVTDLTFTSVNGDLESENLEKILESFINSGAYREATRILFMMTLRQLNRNKLIKWSIWKTDREYYYELKDQDLKAEFLDIMRQYEYVWYGKFMPEVEYFRQLENRYHKLMHHIQSHKN